jgi:hypothetical protein
MNWATQQTTKIQVEREPDPGPARPDPATLGLAGAPTLTAARASAPTAPATASSRVVTPPPSGRRAAAPSCRCATSSPSCISHDPFQGPQHPPLDALASPGLGERRGLFRRQDLPLRSCRNGIGVQGAVIVQNLVWCSQPEGEKQSGVAPARSLASRPPATREQAGSANLCTLKPKSSSNDRSPAHETSAIDHHGGCRGGGRLRGWRRFARELYRYTGGFHEQADDFTPQARGSSP